MRKLTRSPFLSSLTSLARTNSTLFSSCSPCLSISFAKIGILEARRDFHSDQVLLAKSGSALDILTDALKNVEVQEETQTEGAKPTTAPTSIFKNKANAVSVLSYKNLKISTRKLRGLSYLISGLNWPEAQYQVAMAQQKIGKTFRRLLNATAYKMRQEHGIADKRRLLVAEAWVGRATPMKRIRFHGRGKTGHKTQNRSHLWIKLKYVPPTPDETRLGVWGIHTKTQDRFLEIFKQAKDPKSLYKPRGINVSGKEIR